MNTYYGAHVPECIRTLAAQLKPKIGEVQPSGEHTHTTGREPKHALGTTITFRPEHRHGSPRGYNSVTPKMFELLLLQHQSQLGVYAKSKECQPGVDPYSRLKYQLFLETQAAILKAFQSSGPKWYSGGHPGPDSSTFRAQLTFIVVYTSPHLS